jgi:iron complex transport system substrate-binding protein
MLRSALPRIVPTLAAAALLAACGGPPAASAPAGTGTTARNCGIDVTVPGPPQRIYAAYQPAIEMVHALGVSDRVVGTAYLDAQVLPEYAAAQAATEYLPELPSR